MELPGWIVQVLIGGGSAVVVTLGLFRFLGQSWIKHRLDKELERAKSEISLHAAKRMKLHDKEFEVFPEIWARLIDAKASLEDAMGELREAPDFSSMDEEKFEEWLESRNLTEVEKDSMVNAANRKSCFDSIQDNRNLKRAIESNFELQKYLKKTGFFLTMRLEASLTRLKHCCEKPGLTERPIFS